MTAYVLIGLSISIFSQANTVNLNGQQSTLISGNLNNIAYVNSKGDLYTSGGDNYNGLLGHDQLMQGFHKVESLSNVVSIDLANRFFGVVTAEGHAYGLGYGAIDAGLVSIPLDNVKQITTGSFAGYTLLTNDGHVYQYNVRDDELVQLPLTDIIKIDSGVRTHMALNATGEVFTWGSMNQYGQLGHGDFNAYSEPSLVEGIPAIKDIAMGGNHSLVLDHHGYAYSFGLGDWGQLCLGDNNNYAIPTRIDGIDNVVEIQTNDNSYTVLKRNDGSYWQCGFTHLKDGLVSNPVVPMPIQGLMNGKLTLTDGGSVIIEADDGNLYGAGTNRTRMLNTYEDQDVPELYSLHLMNTENIPADATCNIEPEVVTETIIEYVDVPFQVIVEKEVIKEIQTSIEVPRELTFDELLVLVHQHSVQDKYKRKALRQAISSMNPGKHESKADHDKGHGNDADGYDEDNPGKKYQTKL